MIDGVTYPVEVPIVWCRGGGPGGGASTAPARMATTVLYCDICRRWGRVGTAHTCWRNWERRLSDLLIELARGGR
jgi:hypothetical protein